MRCYKVALGSQGCHRLGPSHQCFGSFMKNLSVTLLFHWQHLKRKRVCLPNSYSYRSSKTLSYRRRAFMLKALTLSRDVQKLWKVERGKETVITEVLNKE